jgi:hypothetical protein
MLPLGFFPHANRVAVVYAGIETFRVPIVPTVSLVGND